MQIKVKKISKIQKIKNFIKRNPKKVLAGVGVGTALVTSLLVARNMRIKKLKKAYICNEKVITPLFKMLNKINELNCFLNGAYVFEDPDNKIFNSLIQDNCGDITRDRGTKCAISHDSFWNTKKHPKGNLDEIDPLTKFNHKRAMFEKLIQAGINCNGRVKKIKVILFYPFIALGKNFLYLKLEKSACFTLSHGKDYVKHKTKKKENLLTRRETQKYTDTMKNSDLDFYKKLNISSTNINFYNEKIRAGAELYIPFDVYKKLI